MDHRCLIIRRRLNHLDLQRSISGLPHGDPEPIEAFNDHGQACQSPEEAKGLLADENDKKVDVPRFRRTYSSIIPSCASLAIYSLLRNPSNQHQEALSLAVHFQQQSRLSIQH